jgi:hypothetical protein
MSRRLDVRRDQLEHLIRAAGAILDEREILIVGSQSILGSVDEDRLPPEAKRSIEADLVPFEDPDETKSTLIDGTIGELSPFHETFGVYAHGVGERTARLPDGWRSRLVALQNENTRGIIGWCLEPHDLAVAKMLAGRPHDLEFCRALFRARIIDPAEVRRRLASTDMEEGERMRMGKMLTSLASTGQPIDDDQPTP